MNVEERALRLQESTYVQWGGLSNVPWAFPDGAEGVDSDEENWESCRRG